MFDTVTVLKHQARRKPGILNDSEMNSLARDRTARCGAAPCAAAQGEGCGNSGVISWELLPSQILTNGFKRGWNSMLASQSHRAKLRTSATSAPWSASRTTFLIGLVTRKLIH